MKKRRKYRRDSILYKGKDATIIQLSPGFRILFRSADFPNMDVDRWTIVVKVVLHAREMNKDFMKYLHKHKEEMKDEQLQL